MSALDGGKLVGAALPCLIKLAYEESRSDHPLGEIAAPWGADLSDEGSTPPAW